MIRYFTIIFLLLCALFFSCKKEEEQDEPIIDLCENVSCVAGEICEDGDCITDPNYSNEVVLGDYEGIINSGGDTVLMLIGAGWATPEPLENTPFEAQVSKNTTSIDSLDLSLLFPLSISGLTAFLPIEASVFYNRDSNSFYSAKKDYQIKATDPISLLINVQVEIYGTLNENGELEGTLILDDESTSTDDNIYATLYFEAKKQ